MGRVGSNNRQKEFVKEYESLCHRNNRHQVWQDFVYMAAAAISNSIDKHHADQREEQYLTIIKKYTRAEMEVFPRLFALIVAGMEEYPDQDFLGELYMELELGNSHAGQFFTPYDVCKCMAEIIIDPEKLKGDLDRHGYISIHDCACGAGATLVAAAMVLKDSKQLKGIDFNYQQQALFVAQDIDYTVGLMCYIQLSLLGCAGYVHIGNTLTNPMTGHVLFGDGSANTWYTPMYFSDSWCIRRAVEKAKIIFGQFEAPSKPIPSEPDSTMDSPSEPPETPLQQPTEPDPPAEEPTFVISTKKKNAGQLMFDFGELL